MQLEPCTDDWDQNEALDVEIIDYSTSSSSPLLVKDGLLPLSLAHHSLPEVRLLLSLAKALDLIHQNRSTTSILLLHLSPRQGDDVEKSDGAGRNRLLLQSTQPKEGEGRCG